MQQKRKPDGSAFIPCKKVKKQTAMEVLNDNFTLIFNTAVYEGGNKDLAKIKELLQYTDNRGRSIFHAIIKKLLDIDLALYSNQQCYSAIIRMFCKIDKSSINAQDKQGNTPLHYAIFTISKELIVKLLIDLGADISLQTYIGNNVLHELFIKDTHSIEGKLVEYLLKNEANINTQNNFGNTPVHILFRKLEVTNKLQYLNILKRLIKYNLNFEIQNNIEETVLTILLEKKCIDCASLLITLGASFEHALNRLAKNIISEDTLKLYQMRFAIYAIRNEVLSFLQIDANFRTVLQIQQLATKINKLHSVNCYNCTYIEISGNLNVNYIVRRIATIKSLEEENMLSILALLCSKNKWNNVISKFGKLLIANGCNWQEQDDNGKCALYNTCKSGNIEMLKLIVQQPDFSIHTKLGYNSKMFTPLELCKEFGHTSLVSMLVKLEPKERIVHTGFYNLGDINLVMQISCEEDEERAMGMQ